MTLLLSVTTRPENKVGTNLRQDRAERKLPAVLYGHGVPTVSLFVPANDFVRLFSTAGENTLIDLSVDGNAPVKVLVHDVQYDPISDAVTHVDFYQVNMAEKVSATIPLQFVGVAPAVKDLSGVLVHPMDEVHVSCLPSDLVPHIAVDLGVLTNFDVVITIADLKVPASLEIKHDATEVVALVEPPRSEAEIAALNEKVDIDVSKVEKVEKEKKADEEEEDKK